MPDYNTMTDQQLNIEVAIRRGYRVEEWTFPKPSGYALVAPDGSTIVVSETPGYAWDNLSSCPASDTNAALSLWLPTDMFYLARYHEGWLAWVEDEADSDHKMHYVDATTPARAATICWLMYQDATSP
jgi:hypothetical protein